MAINTTNRYSNFRFRIALSVALLLCISIGTWAQTLGTWQADEAVKPSGSGTKSDPYLIATPANLFWISLNIGKSGTEKAGASNKYYEQTANIDLSGKEWMPIGNYLSGGFFGNYDGQGHVISGMTVDWGNYALALNHATNKANGNIVHDNKNIAYGLFGWFGGKVENLIIDGATIKRKSVAASDLTEDLKIGVLAGIVSDSINAGTRDIIIKNIVVRNSTITDSGTETAKAPAYMVGGLIGDINSGGYTGTSNITSNISISNVVVDADIELAHTNISGSGNDGKGHQYNIGGMVGRMRSAKHRHVPAYAIYSGSINTPRGVTGPIFGFARTNVGTGQDYDNFTKGYAGEFTDATGTLSPHLYFYDYTVRGTQVTDAIPEASTSADGKYTFRTLKSIADKKKYTYNDEGMKMFQGVNHGTYKNLNDVNTRSDVLEKLNIGNENSNFFFIWKNNQFDLQGLEEVENLERTTLFQFKATVRNLKAGKNYTYKWTLTDAQGNSWSASSPAGGTVNQSNDPSGDVVLKILSADMTTPMVSIVGTMRPYRSLLFEVYDGEEMLTSLSYDKIDDVEIKMERDIFTTSYQAQVPVLDDDGNEVKEPALDGNGDPVLDGEGNPVMNTVMETVTKQRKAHFLFKAELEAGGVRYEENPDFFEGITFDWLVEKGTNDTATPDADGFINLNNSEYKAAGTFPKDEAHILSTYVGNIRLKITCSNPNDDTNEESLVITSSIINGETKDYLEMVNSGLHLRITMEECTIDATTGAITTYEFNPADYYVNPELGKDGFYDKVTEKFDPEGLIAGGKTSVIRPLIFKAIVVDQFGNDWTSEINDEENKPRYRIQWNYRMSGEGNEERNQFSPNYDRVGGHADGDYNKVNGRFDATAADYGLETDITDSLYTDYNGRKGHIKLIGNNVLIIHPNILHRTSAFWVRARLFDIEHDPAGKHPIEEILSFNQLGIKLWKNTTENTLEGHVQWKLDPDDKTYESGTSGCILIWYKNPDPTNPNNWVKVQEKEGILKDPLARYTKLDPELYDPTCFYKLYYKSGFDLEAEEIYGPQNVVYVYDRAQTIANRELHTFDPYDDFTNEYYPTGKNTNHGHDPYNAVLTMEQAYKLLDENGSADDNVIVLMGYMDNPDFLKYEKPKGNYNRNVTITGAYGNIKGSTLYLTGENDKGRLLRGATKFQHLTFYGGFGILHFYCGLNDVTFGKGLKMEDYANQTVNNNGLGNYKSQQTTIVGGFHNYLNDGLTYPASNKDAGERLTMTFESGTFGRIISGARTNGNYSKISHNIFGHPEWPHRVKVVVDINDPLTKEQKQVADYHIGLLVGGQTDGSLYSDTELVMNAGTVGRFISGNISYGRAVGDEHPADTYFGSTKLDIYGGEIHELYGGTLGRHSETGENKGTDKCDAFFYGRSIINVYGGTINSQIYGAGAGGVTGLYDYANSTPDKSMHTPDKLIPYYYKSNNNTYTGPDKNQLKYGVYDTATNPENAIPTIRLYNADKNLLPDEHGDLKVLDLSKTYVEVNILGGTVKGNVYGGAFGHSDNIKWEKAIEEAGYLYGNCYVNITGGTIEGNVYGGGAGSKKYNEKDNAHFKEVACVFGNTSVDITGGTITGNVYGGGQGILGFDDMAKLTGNTSVKISDDARIISKDVDGVVSGGNVYGGASFGEIRGCTDVKLNGGFILGNVFGGSEGDPNYASAATLYGKTRLLIDGAEVNGNIYGGCNVSSIRKPTDLTAEEKEAYGVYTQNNGRITRTTIAENVETMTRVIINSGTIGNNIYGGSRGDDTVATDLTDIEGDTYLRINGGSYKNVYYLTDKDEEAVTDAKGNRIFRDFNIFGGGEKRCTVTGTAHLDVRSGLMNIPGMQDFDKVPDGDEVAEEKADDSDVNIFIPHALNPNALADDNTSKFQGPYMDLTYRRFSIYGGGYGEQTNCLNTEVYVHITTEARKARKPHGRTLRVPYDHQSYFDIAGGGYSGDIGYWTDANGERVSANAPASDYVEYKGGQCNVTIDGYTYCRKVIGGGFYGSCLNTNTKIHTGSLRQVYGGSLLGYVHNQAYLEIGNRPADLDDYVCETPEVNLMSPKDKAKWLNDRIFFTENVYGGNDVKGIVGTKQWSWNDGITDYYGQEGTDGGPLWQADIDKEETKGVVMNIYGGTFMGDVFGAGNGHYRGYYVPGWLRYDDGPARNYRMVRGIDGRTYDDDPEPSRHRVYRTRPMVGSVNINITGNNIVYKEDGSIDEGKSDYVKFQGNFFGGGNDCSIGQWNTILPMEDPRRLSAGGHLHVNIGGNVNFAKNFYMGNDGALFGSQKYLPAGTGIDLNTFDGTSTQELVKIGDLAYDHWFYNADTGHYEPGFPGKGEADGNFGLLGEHMFRGYFKNIEMEGDIELTFYKDLYKQKKDEKGNPITVRKRWLPAELAVDAYDAENITMGSFFLGGKCGYMTNNTYNVYCYTDSVGKHIRDIETEIDKTHDHEQWGSVYRIVMPQGVTIKDKLVMGVEDAVTNFYKYNDDFTGNAEADPTYIFEGGLVTQTTYSFDHVAYNDLMTAKNNGVWNPTIFLPDDFYQSDKYNFDQDGNSIAIRDAYSYTLQAGIYAGTKIYRRIYKQYGLNNWIILGQNPSYIEGGTEPKYLHENNQHRRYGLAVVYNDSEEHQNGNDARAEPFFGRRSSRTVSDDHQTVTKLTARCQFDPQVGDGTTDEANYKYSNDLRYGGIIYGGCYNSGVVIGDVILNVASDMLGKNLTTDRPNQIFGDLSHLNHYIGRVYGGGYGVNTRNDGDVYINLLRDVKAMNVFGSGMQGSVYGDTYINYIGRNDSYIYGSIYGGGFQGTVGKYYWRENFDKTTVTTEEELKALNLKLLSQAEYIRLPEEEKNSYHLYVESKGTNVTLISGNVDHVYGGSCMSNLYGATRVHLYDEVADSLPHLDFSQYGDVFKKYWADARLIVGTVYGGNDISGEIKHTDERYQTLDLYDTNVEMTEELNTTKDTPGSFNGYNGYPLVGNLYGGSNGNYDYTPGSTLEYASGIRNSVVGALIGGTEDETIAPMAIPDVGRANIDIQGGTVVNLYGGGDMSTITDNTNIKIAYTLDKTDTDTGKKTYGNIEARAGFKDDEELERVWNTCHVTSQQQMSEILDYKENKGYVFKYNIYRVFGGNNHADMAIQPKWELISGHVGSVYSGANFGRMTYFKAADGTNPAQGLTMEIDSPDFHANALYGGGRVGDIDPDVTGTVTEDFYGSTLIIKRGVIDHIYGGNDVSGTVNHGSRVDIQGAISGNVYCAGNGDHVYQYGYPEDYEGNKDIIGEDYIVTNEETKSGYRYFILPKKNEYSTTDNLEKLKAINSYRPNVTRSNLTIGSTDPDNPAYVHGSIYMGGNSATVVPNGDTNAKISFNIGSNVVINNIFLGSNGENLVDDNMITRTNARNGFNIGGGDDMLHEYFNAVVVENIPDGFQLDPNTENVNIGSFYLGGNRGSMTTKHIIDLEFPENITIFGKIVGGSNNANFEYGTAKHIGGLTEPLAEDNPGGNTKVKLTVRSKFLPMYIQYPDNDWRKARLVEDLRDDQGNKIYRQYAGGVAKAYKKCTSNDDGTYTYSDEYTGPTYLQPGTCNIYGGCYNSGKTVGDIKIDLYSDMLLFGDLLRTENPDPAALLTLRTREQTVVNCVNGIGQKSWHPFSVIGGGYGSGTSVYGNIDIKLLPTVTGSGTGRKVTHPSCSTIFGGAQEGLVVGNTLIELRDGTVLTNVYGAPESSFMYGSTHIFIGYPKHYECTKSGRYELSRADTYSQNAKKKAENYDGSQVVKQYIWYREGDLVPENVYQQIIDADKEENFQRHDKEETPADVVPGTTWDDIEINVGDPSSRNARSATAISTTPYFGHGNVYGGGFIPTGGNSALIGQKTLKRFTETLNPIGSDASTITNYGGNSSIMVWDNPENAKINDSGTGYKYNLGIAGKNEGASGVIKDHVSIGSAKFNLVEMSEGMNKMGLFYYNEDTEEFVHQPSGIYSSDDSNKKFYEIESDGGIYGGGRKVFCEGFCACDLAYYGYADYTPQMAKLINTFQRFDLLSLTDCCLQLQAAQDFASTTADAGERYSITRVGELRMNSSLAGKELTLDAGTPDELNIGNTNHLAKRSRNFLGFYRSVKYLGALVSNVDFDAGREDKLHDKTGAEVNTTTYFKNKQSIVNTYYTAKHGSDPVSNAQAEAFKQRNVGTAANMIGINNGYSLRIQGTQQTEKGDIVVDNGYYGPAIGVTEIKLLTMAIGEGGGYVYALNQHEEVGNKTPNFLQRLGNFVFPGARFGIKTETENVNGVETKKEVPCLNYIIDDCYPIGKGYDTYMGCGDSCTTDVHSAIQKNVNDLQPIHYWYVNGQRYFFNATLTAYTGTPTAEKPSELFTLRNADDLLLAGLETGNETLTIKSIKWEAPNANYDLTRDTDSEAEGVQLVNGYGLSVTVGGEEEETWSHPIERWTRGEIPSTETAKYEASTPLLGVELTDAVSNNDKDYYAEHLSKPGKVQIVLTAKDNEDLDYEYTLNLTIVYLKGTDINGNIVIENCALPGERIYANAFDVTVEGDDPTITNRKWVMYKVDKDDVEIPDNFRVEENSPERIAIPAYYWMNGWHLAYQMNVNGKQERIYVSAEEKTEHKTIDVHNYHRMMAWDRNQLNADNAPDVQDLQLSEGARVYIEDADDLEYFLTYMKNVQAKNCSRHGMIGTDEVSDVDVDPQYAEGIHFILLNDVKMKDDITAEQKYKFGGTFSGMGHAIDLNKCKQFMGENIGSVYFTGFHSKGETKVAGTNKGRILGSYHYNTGNKGKLIETAGDGDRLQYSYQNSVSGVNDSERYTTYYDDLDFANGKVAYDLNALYLNERYLRIQKQLGNEVEDAFEPYVYDYYGDGEYRYANWDIDNRIGTGSALRTDAHPNYYIPARITAEEMDALTGAGATVSAGVGAAAFSKAKTYHNCDHPKEGRYNEVTDRYDPHYPEDFMFWGQNIVGGDLYPKTLAGDGLNRVYRASGFYGTQEDRGFYFNHNEAMMQHPKLTAVDFTGERDRNQVKEQTIIFTPVLDLPRSGESFEGTTTPGEIDLTTISVDGNANIEDVGKVTKNLLVYLPAGKVTSALFPQETEADIEAHRIDWDSVNDKYATAEFHLVDKQDFNAPIEFNVTNRAWYEREPLNFASRSKHVAKNFVIGKDAWEGIALPFTVKQVKAESNTTPSAYYNRGEITHFYGDSETHHDYWLRGLTGTAEEKASTTDDLIAFADFARPGSGGLFDLGEDQEKANYDYANNWMYLSYQDKGYMYEDLEYVEDQDTYQYRKTFDEYRFLTKNAPYIVSYPGVGYYEFDLSGAFFEGKTGEENRQKIVYENCDKPTIKITDEEADKRHTEVRGADGTVTTHYGTFSHLTNDNFFVLNEAVLTDVRVYDDGIKSVSLPAGSAFINCKDFGVGGILPFRTYMTVSLPTQSRAPQRFVMIGEGTSIEKIIEEEEYDDQEDELTGVSIYLEDNNLVIISDHDFTCPLHNVAGILYHNLEVRTGMNVYRNLDSGIYIALGRKFLIK